MRYTLTIAEPTTTEKPPPPLSSPSATPSPFFHQLPACAHFFPAPLACNDCAAVAPPPGPLFFPLPFFHLPCHPLLPPASNRGAVCFCGPSPLPCSVKTPLKKRIIGQCLPAASVATRSSTRRAWEPALCRPPPVSWRDEPLVAWRDEPLAAWRDEPLVAWRDKGHHKVQAWVTL